MSSNDGNDIDHIINGSPGVNITEKTSSTPHTTLPHERHQESVESCEENPNTALNKPALEDNLVNKESRTCSTSVESPAIGVQTEEGLEAPETIGRYSTGGKEGGEIYIMRSASQGSQQDEVCGVEKKDCDDIQLEAVVSADSNSNIISPKVVALVDPKTSHMTLAPFALSEGLSQTSNSTSDGVPPPQEETQPENANPSSDLPKEEKKSKPLSPSVAPFHPQGKEINPSYYSSGLSQQLIASPYPKMSDIPLTPPVYPIFSIPLVRCCYDSQHYNSLKGGLHITGSRRRTCDRGARCYHRHVMPRLGESGGDGSIVEALELFPHLYAPSIKAFYDSVLSNAQFGSNKILSISTFSKLRHDELPCQYGHSCKNELHRQAAEKIQYGEASKKIYDEFSREMRAYEYRVIQQRHQEHKIKIQSQLTDANTWSEGSQYNFANPNFNSNNALQYLSQSTPGSQLQQTPYLDPQTQGFYNSLNQQILSYPAGTPNPYIQQFQYPLLASAGANSASQLNMLAMAASGASLAGGLGLQTNGSQYYNYMLQLQNQQQQQQLQNQQQQQQLQNQQQQQQFGQQPTPQFQDPFSTSANPSFFPNFLPNSGMQPGVNTMHPLLSDSSLRSSVETELDLMSISARSNIGGTQMTRPQSIPQTLLPNHNNFM